VGSGRRAEDVLGKKEGKKGREGEERGMEILERKVGGFGGGHNVADELTEKEEFTPLPPIACRQGVRPERKGKKGGWCQRSTLARLVGRPWRPVNTASGPGDQRLQK